MSISLQYVWISFTENWLWLTSWQNVHKRQVCSSQNNTSSCVLCREHVEYVGTSFKDGISFPFTVLCDWENFPWYLSHDWHIYFLQLKQNDAAWFFWLSSMQISQNSPSWSSEDSLPFSATSAMVSRFTRTASPFGCTFLSCTHKIIIIEPVHEISNNVVCGTSKGSDQPAHTRRLIRAFASRLSILWVLSYWLNTIWSF